VTVERARRILGKGKARIDRSGPVMGVFRTVARYEAFIREGAKLNYRAEWHPGADPIAVFVAANEGVACATTITQ